MAIQMFMKVDGVPGESTNFDYKGWAEILSWNWGMTSARKSPQGNESVKTTLNEMSIVKRIAIDSAPMRLLFAKGETIKTVELTIIPVVGKREGRAKYLNIKLEDVVIKSIVTGGGIEEDYFKEHLTLVFDRVRFVYARTKAGPVSADGPEWIDNNFAWNVSADATWE